MSNLCSRYGWFVTCCRRNSVEWPGVSVCMEYMVPPIKLCTNGHNICSKYTGSIQRCPTCRSKFSVVRNVALEIIARKLKYPCANRQSGCLELFSIEHVAKHNAVYTGKLNVRCIYARSVLGTALKTIWRNMQKQHIQNTSGRYQHFVVPNYHGVWEFYTASTSYSHAT